VYLSPPDESRPTSGIAHPQGANLKLAILLASNMRLAAWAVPIFLVGMGLLITLDGVLLAAEAPTDLRNAQTVQQSNCPRNGPCATLSGIGEQTWAVLTEVMGIVTLAAGIVVGMVRVRRAIDAPRATNPGSARPVERVPGVPPAP
jgi:hypothetical protein